MGSRFWANVALCVVLGILAVLGLTRLSSALTPKGLLATEPEPSPEVAALMRKVRLVDYRLSERPGHMVRAAFYVQNESDRDIKNISILCEFFDRNGRYVDRKLWLLADTVPAGKSDRHTMEQRRFVNTRANGLRCRLADFQVVEPPWFRVHRVEEGHGGEHAALQESGHGETMPGAAAHGAHGEGGH